MNKVNRICVHPSGLTFEPEWTASGASILLDDPYCVFYVLQVTASAEHETVYGWLKLRVIEYIKWLAIDNVCSVARVDLIHLVVWNLLILDETFMEEMRLRYPSYVLVVESTILKARKKLARWAAVGAVDKETSE
jgi:hypothetical protein